MANLVADLEAKLSLFIKNPDAKKAAEELQRLIDLDKELRNRPIGTNLSDNAREQRVQFKSLADTISGRLLTDVSRFQTELKKLEEAGLPLNNLRSLAVSLAAAIERSATAMTTLSTKFTQAHSSFAANPFDIKTSQLGQKSLSFTNEKNTELYRLVNEIWSRIAETKKVADAAEKKVADLLLTAQRSTSILPPGGTRTAATDDIRRNAENIQRMNQQFEEMRNLHRRMEEERRRHVDALAAMARAEEEARRRAENARPPAGGGRGGVNPADPLANASLLDRLAALRTAMAGLIERSVRASDAVRQGFGRDIPAAFIAASQASTVLGGHMQGLMNHIIQYAPMASGPLGGLLNRIASIQTAFGGGFGTAAAVGGFSLLTMGVGKLFNEMVRIERILSPVRELHHSLARTVGEDGAKNFDTLTSVMIKYGLSIEGLSKPIARLKIATDGTVLGGERFKTFLEDFAAVSSKFALPQESIAGMAKAFEQMISKGTVQAEEFRQQLGDRLPAAARIGLAAFQEMTGNSSASFKDFMDAMKDRQIESTRFLDIFMNKLKDTFSITNDATTNLNAAYGRLEGARTLAINNLDRAIGVTAVWGRVIDGLATGFLGLGNAANVAGPAIAFLFGTAALGAVVRIAPVIAGLLPVFRGLSVAGAATATAFYGIQAVLAGFAASQFVGWLSKATSGLFSLGSAAKQFSTEKFKIRTDVELMLQGKKELDARALLTEMAAYISQANAGLKSGKRIEIDVDLTKNVDAAIANLRAKIGGQNLVPQPDKDARLRDRLREYESYTGKVISLSESMDANLKKSFRDTLNYKIVTEENTYDRALLALQKYGLKKSAQEIKNNTETIKRLEDMATKFREAQARVMAASEGMNDQGGFIASFTRMITMSPVLTNSLQGVATVLGIIAAYRFFVLATGLDLVGAAAARAGLAAASLQRKLLLVGAAAAVFAYFSSGAKASEAETAGLAKRLEEVQKQLSANPNDPAAMKELGRSTQDAQRHILALELQLQELRAERDKATSSVGWKDALDEVDKLRGGTAALVRMLKDFLKTEAPGRRPLKDVEAELARVEAQLQKAQAAAKPLNERMKELGDESAKAARELAGVGEGSGGGTKLPSIGEAIEEARRKLKALRDNGLEAYRVMEEVLALKGQYSTGFAEGTSGDLKRKLELVQLQRQLKEETARLENENKKFNKMTFEQAEGIVMKNAAVLEGLGAKMGTAMKQMVKEVDDYRTALRLLGATEAEVAQQTQMLMNALQMQAAGLNLANLQLKPLQAMQKGLESFSDSLANLLVDGKLNAASFSEAFRQMAASIIKDIISMTIKANIVRPLLMGIFNMGGDATWGAGGSWATTVIPHAKGGIVDSPTYFGMGGGKTGLMGEAGAEAILPLRRGPDGSLGVAASGDSGGGGPINLTIQVNNPTSDSVMELKKQLPEAVMSILMQAKKMRYV